MFHNENPSRKVVSRCNMLLSFEYFCALLCSTRIDIFRFPGRLCCVCQYRRLVIVRFGALLAVKNIPLTAFVVLSPHYVISIRGSRDDRNMNLQADGALTLKAFAGLLQKLGFASLAKGVKQYDVNRPAPSATSGPAASAVCSGCPLVGPSGGHCKHASYAYEHLQWHLWHYLSRCARFFSGSCCVSHFREREEEREREREREREDFSNVNRRS